MGGHHESGVAVESVISTEELSRRSPRRRDYEAESRAFVALTRELAHSPASILQKLAETALELCAAGSAGLSLVEEENGQKIFRWRAIAGEFAVHLLGTTPRNFSPCGVVLDQNAIQLFSRPDRYYPYLEVTPTIVEALLIPFAVAGEPVGTIWVMAHDEGRKFDSEDARVMSNLGEFASAAYQALSSLEATKEADRRKDEFLATLSHEMRSPLNTILMWIGMLRTGGLDPAKVESAYAAIERATHLQNRMVSDLLASSSILSGKLSLEFERLDLALLVASVVDAQLGTAKEKRVAIDWTADPGLLWMQGDPARLQQVLGNVLANAIKFTPGGGRVKVRLRRVDNEGEVSIIDTGEGIAPDFLPLIFERFRQSDTSSTRRHAGLGLGLAIARYLVGRHGGTIKAESDGIGCGTKVAVRLPLQRQFAFTSDDVSSPDVFLESDRQLDGIRVLVVDDDPDTRLAVQTALSRANAQVVSASTAREALHSFAADRPDVVVTDLAMPEEDGYALRQAIQDLELGGRSRAPVIALTALATPEDRRRVATSGFALHLTKPVRAAELLEAVALAAGGNPREFAEKRVVPEVKDSKTVKE